MHQCQHRIGTGVVLVAELRPQSMNQTMGGAAPSTDKSAMPCWYWCGAGAQWQFISPQHWCGTAMQHARLQCWCGTGTGAVLMPSNSPAHSTGVVLVLVRYRWSPRRRRSPQHLKSDRRQRHGGVGDVLVDRGDRPPSVRANQISRSAPAPIGSPPRVPTEIGRHDGAQAEEAEEAEEAETLPVLDPACTLSELRPESPARRSCGNSQTQIRSAGLDRGVVAGLERRASDGAGGGTAGRRCLRSPCRHEPTGSAGDAAEAATRAPGRAQCPSWWGHRRLAS
jgi:hypothetical protein